MEKVHDAIESLILLDQRYIIDMVTNDTYFRHCLDKTDFIKNVYPELDQSNEDDMEVLKGEIDCIEHSFREYWAELDDARKIKFIKWMMNPAQIISTPKLIMKLVLQHDLAHRLNNDITYPEEIFEKFN